MTIMRKVCEDIEKELKNTEIKISQVRHCTKISKPEDITESFPYKEQREKNNAKKNLSVTWSNVRQTNMRQMSHWSHIGRYILLSL